MNFSKTTAFSKIEKQMKYRFEWEITLILNLWEFLFLEGELEAVFFEVFFRDIFSESSQKYVICIFKTSFFPRRMFWIYTLHTFDLIPKKYRGKTLPKNGLQSPPLKKEIPKFLVPTVV